MVTVVAWLCLLVIPVASRRVTIEKQVGQYYKNCDDAANSADAQPIFEHFAGQSATINGVTVSGLECIGAGGFGIVFSGKTAGKGVIVKFFFGGAVKDASFAWAQAIQTQVAANPRATGADSFVSAVQEGMTDELPDTYAQVWARAPGLNLDQIQGPLHMDKDDEVIGTGMDSSKYGFDRMFGSISRTTARVDYLDFQQKVCEGIIFMWSVGLRHLDIQGSNVMWDGRSRKFTFVDYDTMVDTLEQDETNGDVNDAWIMFANFRGPKGQKAKALEEDLETNMKTIQSSLTNFVSFYQRHFKPKVSLATRIGS